MNEEQELPQGWVLTTLQDVSSLVTDGTHKTPNYQESGIRFISIANIKPFKPVNWSNYEKYITIKEHEELIKRAKPEFGDILFPRIGTLGYAKIIDFEEEVSIFVGLGLVKPLRHIILPKYLEYFMNTSFINDYSRTNATGSGRLTLSLEASRRMPVVLAPLSEQRRIVAKLEELFSRLDAGVAAVRRTQALLKRYRQSVLHAAVTGELTRAWREAHPAAPAETGVALLQRIRAERRAQWEAAQVAKRGGQLPLGEGWKSNYAEPEAADTEGLPELPAGWAWASMKLLTSKITDGEHLKPKVIDSGVPFISAKDVRESGVIFTDCLYVSQSDAAKFRTKCNPSRGDILMVSRGATVGRSCIVDTDQEFCLLGSVILLKVISGISSKFLLSVITSPTNSHLLSSVSGATAQQAIYLRDIEPLAIPLPPLAEQAEIVAEVERRLTVLDALSRTLGDELRRAERLRQSILHRAFTGRLVPQEATDEPAAALLARLRETASSSKTRKTKEIPIAPAKEKKPRGRKPVDTTQIDFSFSNE